MNKRSIVPGAIISAALFLICAAFVVFLICTYLFPVSYLLIIGGCLLVVCAGVFLLTHKKEKKVKFIIGCVLTALTVIFMGVAFYMLHSVTDTIKSITGADNTETVQVSVYVKTDDPAESLNDTVDYTFCILKTLDRESTDLTIEKIKEELGKEIKTEEYETMLELLNAVLDGEKKAIVTNPSFLEIMVDLEGYADIDEKFREIAVKYVEIVIPEPDEEEPFEEEPPQDTDLTDGVVIPAKVKKPDGVFQVFISGIDTRGSKLISRSRSDVNIIATINTNTHEVLLVTTPRDYYVPLSISNGVRDKLTHAGIYGVNVSIETLEMLYGIDIDYYFRLNFEGFADIIDAIGGIDVYSEYAYKSLVHEYVVGMNHMNGKKALRFVRDRYAVPGGDTTRAKHQMAVIKAVIEKITTSTTMLENFGPLLESVKGSFESDIPYDVIAKLVRDQLSTMPKWKITTYSVNGTGAKMVPYSMSQKAYVSVPKYETVATAKQKMNDVILGKTEE